MSRRKITFVENSGFVLRFVQICGTSEPAKVARLFNIPYQSAKKNYLAGRLPSPYVLQVISENISYSIHWLLTGKGEKFISSNEEINEYELTDEIKSFIKEICMETINYVSVESKDDAEKILILSPDKIKQEKFMEDSEEKLRPAVK